MNSNLASASPYPFLELLENKCVIAITATGTIRATNEEQKDIICTGSAAKLLC
jgi:hypothetical protein